MPTAPQVTYQTNLDGTISIGINDGFNPSGHIEELSDFRYERSDIPQELIDECEKMSENGETHFIFDTQTTNLVKSRWKDLRTDEKRDLLLDQLLDVNKYHIGNVNIFSLTLPSRFSYYDTETKLSDRYERYNAVIGFLNKIGFVKNDVLGANYGPEFEQSFILEMVDNQGYYKILIRLRPNLFISLSTFTSSEIVNQSYDGFFNKEIIIKILRSTCPEVYKAILRDYKLDELLNLK